MPPVVPQNKLFHIELRLRVLGLKEAVNRHNIEDGGNQGCLQLRGILPQASNLPNFHDHERNGEEAIQDVIDTVVLHVFVVSEKGEWCCAYVCLYASSEGVVVVVVVCVVCERVSERAVFATGTLIFRETSRGNF